VFLPIVRPPTQTHRPVQTFGCDGQYYYVLHAVAALKMHCVPTERGIDLICYRFSQFYVKMWRS
jgi:hypothetical protein